MTIRALLFGHYRDFLPPGAENGVIILDLPDGVTITDVAHRLAENDARLCDLLARTRAAVNAEFAGPETSLSDKDEVAFLPPMSGG